jgi:hypothetical protein
MKRGNSRGDSEGNHFVRSLNMAIELTITFDTLRLRNTYTPYFPHTMYYELQ